MEKTMEYLQYPVGRFVWPREVSKEDLDKAIQKIAGFPAKINDAVRLLDEAQLDTPYRPEGWTVRQVVHHCADSHMNAYIRFKLALTEDKPTIKPYDQAKWAMLHDSQLDPGISLDMITGIHLRWVTIMENMSEADWKRSFMHPEHNTWQVLMQVVIMYAWHCEHHWAHITRLLEREGW